MLITHVNSIPADALILVVATGINNCSIDHVNILAFLGIYTTPIISISRSKKDEMIGSIRKMSSSDWSRHFSVKIKKIYIYRSDVQVTFGLCGHFRYLQVLYSRAHNMVAKSSSTKVFKVIRHKHVYTQWMYVQDVVTKTYLKMDLLWPMVTSWNGNVFRTIDPFRGLSHREDFRMILTLLAVKWSVIQKTLPFRRHQRA